MDILLVDDENLSRESMARFLEYQLNHKVTQCSSGEEALNLFKKHHYPIVLSDICMPGINGLDLLREIRKMPDQANTQIALFTGFANVDTAIQALREGADDYIRKPINVKELVKTIEKLTNNLRVQKGDAVENGDNIGAFDGDLSKMMGKDFHESQIEIEGLGKIGIFSERLRKIFSTCLKFHDHRSIPVLIMGETGTGKEVIASFIHHGNEGSDLPFVSINCSAITPSLFESELFGYEEGAFTGAKRAGQMGKLELAQGGTLFLDEIGDMPLDLQPKLLRALETKDIFRIGGKKKIKLDVRFIAATNQNLEKKVDSGQFRKDLYFRLKNGLVQMPALRETKETIVPLAQMFLTAFSNEKKRRFQFINKEAMKILEEFPWTGNIRELKNAIEMIVLLNDGIELLPEHLSILKSEGFRGGTEINSQVLTDSEFALPQEELDIKKLESIIILKAMEKFGGNKTQVARYLGLSRGELRSRLAKAMNDKDVI
jgi:DNA-binding NtrC family response regulator